MTDEAQLAESDRAHRRAFEKFLPEIFPDTPDLSLALLEALLFRETDQAIIDEVSNFSAMEREIGFTLFRLFLRASKTSASEVFLQDAILRALLDPESPWQLRLGYGRRGRPRSAFADLDRFVRESRVFERMKELVGSGVKVESAASEVAKEFGLGRSKVFEVWQNKQTAEDRYSDLEKRLHEYRPESRADAYAAPRSKIRRFWDYITQEF